MSEWINRPADTVKSGADAEQKNREWLALRREILSAGARSGWNQLVEACKGDIQTLNSQLSQKFPNDHTKLVEFQFTPFESFTIRRVYYPFFRLDVSFDASRNLILAEGKKSPGPQIMAGFSNVFTLDVEEKTGVVVLIKSGSGAPLSCQEASRLLIGSCLK